MFVRTLDELQKLERIRSPLADDSFRSARFLTAADGMGFSYNENRVKKGADTTIWLKHHWEANYIIAGRGEVTDLTSGERYSLKAGVLYVVGPNDRHRFRIAEDEHHISVFRPPLKGDERFDEDGVYTASGPIEKTDRRMFAKCADEMRKSGEELIAADGQARSIQMLTEADGIGFGFSDVHFTKGAEAILPSRQHWEANHVISGTGEVTDLTTGETWKLEPSMAYIVGPKDRHRIRAYTDIHLVSVFCPPDGRI